jgi:hypothetical protein
MGGGGLHHNATEPTAVVKKNYMYSKFKSDNVFLQYISINIFIFILWETKS